MPCASVFESWLAAVSYGYRRLTVLLKREGWKVKAKRIYQIYTEEGLIVRTKKRKERAQRQRVARGSARRPNQKWSMDFVAIRFVGIDQPRFNIILDRFSAAVVFNHVHSARSGYS